MLDFLTLYATAEGESVTPAEGQTTEGTVTSGVEEESAAAQGGGLGGMLMQIGFIAILIIGFYFIMIRPQQKRQKKERELRENVQIGDTIVTIGGIVGIVTNIKEDNISVETGGGSKMVFKKFAIQTIETIHD